MYQYRYQDDRSARIPGWQRSAAGNSTSTSTDQVQDCGQEVPAGHGGRVCRDRDGGGGGCGHGHGCYCYRQWPLITRLYSAGPAAAAAAGAATTTAAISVRIHH